VTRFAKSGENSECRAALTFLSACGAREAAGALMNMPEFAKAFDCQAGDKMVKSSDQVCKIW
jgi:predicted metalloendopeptidase